AAAFTPRGYFRQEEGTGRAQERSGLRGEDRHETAKRRAEDIDRTSRMRHLTQRDVTAIDYCCSYRLSFSILH
ncbi:hypothetical protein, partial [Rhodosalinus sp.]|uniref:hypothetical protein n=1 Tax=Rhodosalinus sp. TaxID=2047741 RepID=UPI00397A0A0A